MASFNIFLSPQFILSYLDRPLCQNRLDPSKISVCQNLPAVSFPPRSLRRKGRRYTIPGTRPGGGTIPGSRRTCRWCWLPNPAVHESRGGDNVSTAFPGNRKSPRDIPRWTRPLNIKDHQDGVLCYHKNKAGFPG